LVALLDVNVLIALFDPMHTHHEIAHGWFGNHRTAGWATCPLTETAVVRILSNPAYPGQGTTVSDAIARLQTFRASGHHTFWPDDLSLCDPERFDTTKAQGHRQITDAYLLALAVHHGGCLTTFDTRIPVSWVRGARGENLQLLGA
jgi:toxin-antitoxin system PIN domain toxin